MADQTVHGVIQRAACVRVEDEIVRRAGRSLFASAQQMIWNQIALSSDRIDQDVQGATRFAAKGVIRGETRLGLGYAETLAAMLLS